MAARLDLGPPSRAPLLVPIVLTLGALAFGLWRLRPEVDVEAPDLDTAPLESPPPPTTAPALPLAPRCVETSREPFVIGEPPPPKLADAGAAGDEVIDFDDPSVPFAVEIGRGAAFDRGFAVGVRRDAEGGALAMVATVAADGSKGELVKLGRSRGDLDAPVVAGAGASVLAVMVEPNASGRSLKVAKITDREVAWGPEYAEGRDDSLAMDVAASGALGVLAWDDLDGVGEAARGRVMLARFDVTSLKPIGTARPVSLKENDATAPHLIARPGGFWLAYLVHGDEVGKKPNKKRDDDEPSDDGEVILPSWIEAVPLDDSGALVGAPRAVTSKTGHVLAFDLELSEGGNALVAFRDDETPTGSAGGSIGAALVRLGGASEARVLLDRAGGPGTPDLLPGWISIASVNGATRVAAISPTGALLEDLAPEPSLGGGEPLAAQGDSILWARPAGKAMRLSVVRCTRRQASDAGP